MYYLRTKPAANALQFTVDKSKLRNASTTTANKSFNSVNEHDEHSPVKKNGWLQEESNEGIEAILACSRENGDACMACGS